MNEDLQNVFIIGEAKPIRVRDKDVIATLLGKFGTPVMQYNELDVPPLTEETLVDISESITLKVIVVGGEADAEFRIYINNELKMKLRNSAANPILILPLGSGLAVNSIKVTAFNLETATTAKFHASVWGVK